MMNDKSSSPSMSKPGQKGRSKVKSGCRTCKVRRVKCDEGRPACRRCVSTGRKCDGYGIWGGGGVAHTHHTDGRIALKRNPFPMLGDASGDHEHCCFEWFRSRTITKLPGAFESYFWDTLVMRASFTEPAVLHAVLALGSVHKQESLALACGTSSSASSVPDEEERFALRHYSRAIRRLQPHFAANSKESIRVALISCMIFTCLEFLRGHYRTGNEHLKNGMRLLGGLVASSPTPGAADREVIDLDVAWDPADEWLVESFAKLNLQAVLFGQGAWGLYYVPQSFDTEPLPVLFKSMTQARKRLDWLMSDAYELTSKWKRANASGSTLELTDKLINHRERIKRMLPAWMRIYKVSRVGLLSSTGVTGPLAYQLLFLYYPMIRIMVETCFRPKGESSFDDFTDDFVEILRQTKTLIGCVAAIDLSNTSFAHDDLTPFILDRGPVPPLHFVAIHCRVPFVRRQAIRMLRAVRSREGLWDAALSSTCAEEVMRLEEGDFYTREQAGEVVGSEVHSYDSGYEHFHSAFEAAFSSPASDTDDELPALPELSRMFDVQVELPDGPLNTTTISCRRKNEFGDVDLITRVYDPVAQTWSDAGQQIETGSET